VIPIKDNLPNDRFPFVTVGLIVANFVVYFLAVSHGGSVVAGPDFHELVKYGAIPYTLTHPGVHCVAASGGPATAIACGKHLTGGAIPTWETVFTSMFMHASIFQILGNMLFLWIFGNTIEDTMGPIKYLGFYIVGGLVALGLQVAVAPNSTAPTIGAAGAVAAVLGGYALLYPQARVFSLVIIILFVTVIEVPTFVMVAIWFVMQAIFWVTDLTNPSGATGGAAYLAQVGAFGFGLLAVRLLASRRKTVPPPHPVY
jgi:membrane associated rhomboid family serine protease